MVPGGNDTHTTINHHSFEYGFLSFQPTALAAYRSFLLHDICLPSESRIHARDVSYTSLGYFVDSGSRILPSKIISTNDMTAAKCAVNCVDYDYFGKQWSSECYCGSEAPTNSAPAAEYNMAFAGNPAETCGFGMRLNVYKPATASPATPPAPIGEFEYKGCYSDNVPQRVLAGTTVARADMTLENCAVTCAAGGYSVFGVEYSSECYCGTTIAPAPTYNGTPERCFNTGAFPKACRSLTSNINPQSVSNSARICKGDLT